VVFGSVSLLVPYKMMHEMIEDVPIEHPRLPPASCIVLSPLGKHSCKTLQTIEWNQVISLRYAIPDMLRRCVRFLLVLQRLECQLPTSVVG